MSQKSNRQRNRDNPTVGLYVNKRVNPVLANFFFGKDGTEKLSAEKFLSFQVNFSSFFQSIIASVDSLTRSLISILQRFTNFLFHNQSTSRCFVPLSGPVTAIWYNSLTLQYSTRSTQKVIAAFTFTIDVRMYT